MATTGINAGKVAAIQKAINDYAQAIDNCKLSITSKNLYAAIKGTNSAKNIKALAQTCDSKANNFTNGLRSFSNRIGEVKTAYVKNDQNNASATNVAAQVKNLKS